MIINSLLKVMYPFIGYNKIDGTVTGAKRFSIIKRFNEGTKIKILLLTT